MFTKMQTIFLDEPGLVSAMGLNHPVIQKFKNKETNNLSNGVLKQIGTKLGYTPKIVMIPVVASDCDVKNLPNGITSPAQLLSSFDTKFVETFKEFSSEVKKEKEANKLLNESKKVNTNIGVLTQENQHVSDETIQIDLNLEL